LRSPWCTWRCSRRRTSSPLPGRAPYSLAFQISASAAFASGWANLGSALSTLAILWNQHRCSRVSGSTYRRATQNRRRRCEHRGPQPATLARAEQVEPGLRKFALSVVEGDQFPGAVSTHATMTSRHTLVLRESDLGWIPSTPPHADEVGVRQRALIERLSLLLPVPGHPGDGGRRQAAAAAKELPQRRAEVRGVQAMRVQQRHHRGDLGLQCRREHQSRSGGAPASGHPPRVIHRF
jgi:hypothetical protein